ncbi:MAG: hypothetical protein NVSMB57_09710 [Actinomycetota bacterium]
MRRLAVVTALVGIGAAHALHSYGESPSASLIHWGSDSVLALPLAAFAVLAGARAASALRANASLVMATIFAVLLVPGSAVHSLIENTHHREAFSVLHAASDAGKVFFVVVGLLLLLHARLPRVRSLSPLVASLAIGATFVAPLQARIEAFAVAPGYAAFSLPLNIPPVLSGDNITLTAQEADVQVAPGTKTHLWTYNGMFPGPTIRRRTGSPLRVTLINQLPAAGDLTMHHHGNHSSPPNDGQPATNLITPGSRRTYNYALVESGHEQRAGFQWYHDHHMMQTARNVWMGLAGMLILDDSLDNPNGPLNLPSGSYDVPLMMADRSLDKNNQLPPFKDDANGHVGDINLVNGVAQPYFSVEARKYRLRILNASNLQPYQVAFANGMSFEQIATESGLLPAPIRRTSLNLGPAERAEIVVDFKGMSGNINLLNLAVFGPKKDIMQFRVGPASAPDLSRIPATLKPVPPAPAITSMAATRLWILGSSQVGSLEWTINGRGFDASRIDATPVRGTSEQWVFLNTTPVNHYIHLHDVDWRLLARISSDSYDPADTLAEQGFKETFLVRPNEAIVVAATFTDHLGTYVVHCHVLEHEDMSIMAQFSVVDKNTT